MTKEFYPEGVFRLPTGKLHRAERPEDGIRRELLEETGFELPATPIGAITYRFESDHRNSMLASHIYKVEPTDEVPFCQDSDEGICGFGYASREELRMMAAQLRSLSGRWKDWGRFRAIVHDVVADILENGG